MSLPTQRALQEIGNVADPVSLCLKREAIRKGYLTCALKIWLDPAIVDEKKIVATRRGHVRFYERKMAEFAARDARRSLLLKQRGNARRLNPTVLRLLRHRDQCARKEGVVSKKSLDLLAERERDWAEMKRPHQWLVVHNPSPHPKEQKENGGTAWEESWKTAWEGFTGATLTDESQVVEADEQSPSDDAEQAKEDAALAKQWEAVVYKCLKAMRESERRDWLVEQDQQERLERGLSVGENSVWEDYLTVGHEYHE
ncbi:hypothetical protein C8R44DRAFT_877182 [Mycena epipterygia]|nr:hypothetical protein C8R44DRAFT_877182 [Mycena epipterygia]